MFNRNFALRIKSVIKLLLSFQQKSLVEENRRSKNATGWSSTNLLSNDASLDSTESKPKLPKLNVTAPAEVLADERSQGVGMRKKSKSMLNSEKRQSNLAKSPSCPTPGSRPISGEYFGLKL